MSLGRTASQPETERENTGGDVMRAGASARTSEHDRPIFMSAGPGVYAITQNSMLLCSGSISVIPVSSFLLAGCVSVACSKWIANHHREKEKLRDTTKCVCRRIFYFQIITYIRIISTFQINYIDIHASLSIHRNFPKIFN